MLFSSVTFLYYFLPVVLAVYFFVPASGGRVRARNYVLLIASLIFYAWGEPVYLLLLMLQTLSAWGLGLLIDRCRGSRAGKRIFMLSVAISLGSLLFFKYADFFLKNAGLLIGRDIPLLKLALPIGISFYTFQILSYTFDLYRGDIGPQRNYFMFTAYTTLFPQLIAGPIVRYADVAREFCARAHSLGEFAAGARRFVFGLGKKVLLANTMASLIKALRLSGERSALASWLYLAAFGLQVYFDFSGYSDMAIGMGRMLGFRFLENFNYPYIARSVTEFWRRWHMSLSSWFRDYVYFPMGGSRVKWARHCLNLLVVWALTGFWHGADWNFMLWGLYYATLLIIEKYPLRGLLPKLPGPIAHIYTLLLVTLSWVFFDAPDLAAAWRTFGDMFGAGGLAGNVSLYYLRSYAVPMAVGIIGATRAPMLAAERLREKAKGLMAALEPLSVAVILAVVTAFLVDGSFNPFIYFRF